MQIKCVLDKVGGGMTAYMKLPRRIDCDRTCNIWAHSIPFTQISKLIPFWRLDDRHLLPICRGWPRDQYQSRAGRVVRVTRGQLNDLHRSSWPNQTLPRVWGHPRLDVHLRMELFQGPAVALRLWIGWPLFKFKEGLKIMNDNTSPGHGAIITRVRGNSRMIINFGQEV